jgi:hypothetical protein
MAADDKSAVAVEPSPTEVLKAATPAQRKTWRATGDLPAAEEKPAEKKAETKDSETKADSSTAAKTEVAAPAKAEKSEKAEVSAKSAPAVEEPKANAETRIKDLLTQNKELKSKLDELSKQPVAAPAKTEVPARPLRHDIDEKTKQPKYATDADFEEARDKWLTEKVTSDVRKQVAKEENDRRVAEQNKLIEKRLENSLKICMEKHADFKDVVQLKEEDKDGKKITTFNSPALKLIKIGGMIDGWIIDSEIGSEIMYYLATRPEEVERIQAMSAFSAVRELVKLEDKLSSPAPIKKEEKSAESSPAPQVSKAPAPAESVGGKGTAPADGEEAAVAAGDFRRFQREANATDFRQKKAS